MNRQRLILLWLMLATLCGGLLASGASKYIRSGATAGAKTGADWANAYTNFPTSWVRGDTYYVAVGTYPKEWPGHTLNTAASGTSLITIKKATIADHGAAGDWDDSYAGQAVIDGNIGLVTDYWVIDGATRDEANWRSNVYGFRMDGAFYWREDWFYGDDIGDNVTIQYVDVGGTASETFDEDHPDVAFYFTTYGDPIQPIVTNITVSRCHVHNVDLPFSIKGNDGIVIEYCHIGPSWTKETIRGETTAKNVIIRYNVLLNASQIVDGDPPDGRVSSTAQIGIWDAGNDSATGNFDGCEIYGNIIGTTLGTADLLTTDHIIFVGASGAGEMPTANNVKVYNNTIFGFEGNASGIRLLTGANNEIRNNLYYDVNPAPGFTAAIQSNNSNYVSSPFINYAGGDYRLTAPTVSGTSLSTPYNTDITGATRGADGVFDIGAYEYASGSVPQTMPILNVGTFIVRPPQ